MRPLTKSRFKLAMSCPTKLFYTGKAEYGNRKDDDTFLEALAEGGYQVGELAKCYFPGGYDITEKGYEEPLIRTNELLKKEKVVIFEAAIQFQGFFIRIDILEKKGDKINLIEVKAKSYDGGGADCFLTKSGSIEKEWNDYLQDVAYQKYVLQNAFPNWKIKAYLMLADKSKRATVSGLNQRFLLVKDHKNRISVKNTGETTSDTLGSPILSKVNVDEITNGIIADTLFVNNCKPKLSFSEKIQEWAQSYAHDEKLTSPVGAHCFSCEFHTDNPDLRSGFHECWKQLLGFSDEDFQKPMIDQVWNFKGKKKLLKEGIFFMDDIRKEHIGKTEPNKDGTLSMALRQWMQVEKAQQKNDEFFLDYDGMRRLMDRFTFPLHFIDFETSMVAIPFYKGQRPYETIAFQFSHHIMYEDGRVEHKDEFIKTERGEFPNFEFLRELKKALEKDEGTIFRYAKHENTVLNQINRQLQYVDKNEIPDKNELQDFIFSITNDKRRTPKAGKRNMVDMWQMVKDYFYDPRTLGSNSIKAVLPAVLSRSEYIQDKYSKPVYGQNSEIPSKNFPDGWIWIQRDEYGNVIDPYKLLPKLFDDIDLEEAEKFITNNELNSGGAALTAFAKMQFTEMTSQERDLIVKGLLKYCELDTLAMVMIYEFWRNEVNSKGL